MKRLVAATVSSVLAFWVLAVAPAANADKATVKDPRGDAKALDVRSGTDTPAAAADVPG